MSFLYNFQTAMNMPTTTVKRMTMNGLAAFLLIALLGCTVVDSRSERRVCRYLSRSFGRMNVHQIGTAPHDVDDDEDYDTDYFGHVNGSIQICPRRTRYCYALWINGPSNATQRVHIIAQGCWDSSGGKECERESCITDSEEASLYTNFCCCKGNLCNGNFSLAESPDEDYEGDLTTPSGTPPPILKHAGGSYIWPLFLLIALSILTLLSSSALIYFAVSSRRKRATKRQPIDGPGDLENGMRRNSIFNVESLEILDS